MRSRETVSKIALALSSALAAPSWAQASAAESSGGVIDEIVVTATRREQSIQDVGVAVNAFSQEDLRKRGITDVASLADAVPGVKLLEATGGGVPVLIIRGVGLQDFRINNTPTAAIYVDDVYQTSVAQAGFTFFDLERLEVLKGPQGGLYGRNTTGGALQVISRRPSLTEWSGYAEAGLARFGTMTFETAVGGPLSEAVGLRVSGRLAQSADGYTRSTLQPGRSHGEEDRAGLRALLLFKPSDNFELLLKGQGGYDRSETPLLRVVPIWISGQSAVPGLGSGVLSNFVQGRADPGAICPDLLAGRRPNFATCGTLTGVAPGAYGLSDNDRLQTASNPLNRLNNSWWGVSANARLTLGEIELSSITAFDNFKAGRFTDWDATPEVFQHIDYKSDIDAFSQEIRLAYSSDRLDVLAGGNYARDTLVEDTLLSAEVGTVPLAFRTRQVFQPYRQRTTQWAGYGRLDWRFADRLTFVGEARYTDEQKTFAGGTFLVDPNRFLVQVDRRASFGDYSGKIALEFRPTDDLLFYGSISRGYKSGGFFGGIATNVAQTDPYRPETVLSYEGGFKTELFDRRVRANGALYYYDYSDLQGFGRETSGSVQIQRLTNIGDARIVGAEFDLTLVPADGLTLSGNVAYTDGEITRSTLTVSDSFNLSTRNEVTGQPLNNTPRWNLAGLARYDAALTGDLTLGLQADVSYRSSQQLGFINIPAERPLFHEEGYALVGARVNLAGRAGWEIAVWGKNIFNQIYRNTARTDSFGGFYEVYGLPATYGMSARFTF